MMCAQERKVIVLWLMREFGRWLWNRPQNVKTIIPSDWIPVFAEPETWKKKKKTTRSSAQEAINRGAATFTHKHTHALKHATWKIEQTRVWLTGISRECFKSVRYLYGSQSSYNRKKPDESPLNKTADSACKVYETADPLYCMRDLQQQWCPAFYRYFDNDRIRALSFVRQISLFTIVPQFQRRECTPEDVAFALVSAPQQF